MALESSVDTSPQHPDLLGHYKLLEKIAQGGMAEIFKAETYDPNGLRREVVIKRILPHIASHQEFVDMLIDEAKIAVHFNHGNIAQIYDLGKVGKDYFIVMEHVSGKTLQQIFKRAQTLKEKIPVPFCLYFISELCAGLAYMHRKTNDRGMPLNVVHRDISPQNIIVSYSGNVKIIDFGVAKASDKIATTESGVLKGKFAYMSPEQAEGDEIDARSDIFSTGIILWEILAGERLFRKKNNAQTLKAIKKADVPNILHHTQDLPKELEKVLDKALAKSVKKRYLSAEDIQVDLTRILYDTYPSFKPNQIFAYLERLFSPDALARQDGESREGEVAKGEELTKKEKVSVLDMPMAEDKEPTIKRGPAISLDDEPAPTPVEVGEETLWVRRDDIDMVPVIRALDPREEEPTTPYVPPKTAPPPRASDSMHRIEEELDQMKSLIEQELSLPKALVVTDLAATKLARFRLPRRLALVALLLVLVGGLVFWFFVRTGKELPDKPLLPALDRAALERALLERVPEAKDMSTGFLIVESDPPGADIFIDDVNTGKKTPAIIADIVPDRGHELGLAAQGLAYYSELVTLVPGETRNIRASLLKNSGVFSFVTEPAGAYVWLDGKVIGETPILNYEIEPDTMTTLKYTLAGYREWQTTFKVHGGERRQLMHSFVPVEIKE